MGTSTSARRCPMVARRVLVWLPLAAPVLAGYLGGIAAAGPPLFLTDYRFITPKSVVDVTSLSGGANMQLNILGRFGLVKGWNEEVDPTTEVPQMVPFEQFTNVREIMFETRRATPLT